MNKDIRIIFMGTPDFAVESLRLLIENKLNVVAVITAPDKPAGRGQKLQESPVKKYAVSENIPVLQPEKLKNEDFIEELRSYKADLQIVVAFRMLPEVVWNMPPIGTFNLHGSLLPQYRGAAPINWAVINGEKVSGITTFFLKHKIDTGDILFRKEVNIGDNDTAGEVHDKLMVEGAKLVVKTVDTIITGNYETKNQNDYIQSGEEIKDAPKIFKNDCRINWNGDGFKTHNFIRGLSPYPTAWTELVKPGSKTISVKIFQTVFHKAEHKLEAGTLVSDKKTEIKIATKGGYIEIISLQQAGKKRLTAKEFLIGFQQIGEYKIQ